MNNICDGIDLFKTHYVPKVTPLNQTEINRFLFLMVLIVKLKQNHKDKKHHCVTTKRITL
jgi:hypothetical protein